MLCLDARNSRPVSHCSLRAARGVGLRCISALLSLWIAGNAAAVEPADEFLKGLRERGLNELALDYLELMKTSQAVDDEFRETIPYYRGVVLIEQSRLSADSATRARLLDDARSELERFAAANPENVAGAEATLELGSVQLSGGQQLLAQMNQLSEGSAFDAQRQKLSREAREMFANARSMFEQAEGVYSTEIEKLPPTDEDAGNASNKRQEYRARIAQLRFLAAQTQFELAQTYPPDGDEFRKLNEDAAAELSALYEEFARTFIVGLYARLYEGRCYQAVGSYPLALGCYEEVLKQPNVLAPFRKLIASAVHRKAEVLIAQEKYDAAIETSSVCLRDAKSEEETQPEWLAVRYRLADALRLKAESLDFGTLDQRKILAEARDAYRFVAKTPGEFQTAARTAATTLRADARKPDNGNVAELEQPKTFQAAYDLGKDALASYNMAKAALPSAKENNPDAVPELQKQMDEGKEKARQYFRAASILVDDDTDLKLLNEVRYFLCWLYWENQDYYRAAVLGEFLARRYPDHPAASPSAKLAMASYEQLYFRAAQAKSAKKNDTDFEADRMAGIADFIARRWPGSEDANAAQSVLVSFAIRNNRIDEAEKLLASAPEKSRLRLELQLGNAMWGRYLELSQPNAKGADDAQLTRMKESAVKYLQSGFEAARNESEPTEATAAAGLYLAQALLNDEKYAEAIELLEDDKAGPLTLISSGNPAASRSAYAVEAYKAALRAYVLSDPPQEKKALSTMKALDATVTEGGGDKEQLTQIYIGLGVALEKQAAALREAGRDADAARINAAFAQFLDRIAAQQDSANWPTRAWLAQTYYNMGAGDADDSTKKRQLTDRDRDYLTKSRDAYQQLIADATKDPALAPSENALLAARMQLGESFRALGDYKLALDTFSAVLKERETSLIAQRAAALTYQQRGQADDVRWFENAIHGGYKLRSTGQNRIWGWLKISQVAARAARSDEKYRDTFFEARLNVAKCRYLAALKGKGNERKQDLAKAKQSIQSVEQVYPDLGGDHWRPRFDALLKQIQSAAGQKASGLSEFKSEPSPKTSGRGG
jgi:tetratricopeptide (TPR) repeat protein